MSWLSFPVHKPGFCGFSRMLPQPGGCGSGLDCGHVFQKGEYQKGSPGRMQASEGFRRACSEINVAFEGKKGHVLMK